MSYEKKLTKETLDTLIEKYPAEDIVNYLMGISSSDKVDTLFNNFMGDKVQLYIERQGENEFLISDNGQMLDELEMNGIELSKKKQKALDEILTKTKAKNKDGVLQISAKAKEFKEKEHQLLSAIMQIDALIQGE